MATGKKSQRISLKDKRKLEKINPDTKQYISKYKIDMSLRELSGKTVEQYLYDLDQWLVFVYDNQYNQSVAELTEDDINEFLFYCKQQGNNTNRMQRRMSTLSAFYQFMRRKRQIKEDPMEFIARPKDGMPIVQQTYLTKSQIAMMQDKLQENGDTQLYCYAMFSLITMARVNAVSHLRWEQIDLENMIATEVLEKEGKLVTLYQDETVRDLLIKLQEERKEKGIDDHGYVFYTRYVEDDKPVSNITINSWCKKIGRMIGCPTLHPHDFRHSGATLLKNEGMALEDISALLNHESTEVTKKFYIKEDIHRLQEEKKKFSFLIKQEEGKP